MKLLFLYRYIAEYDFDNWLHMKYVEYIKQHRLVDVVAYGPSLHEAYKSVVPIPYNSELTMEDLHRDINFDVVICMTKSRMFHYYNPHTEIAKDCWLPKDFDTFKKTPKVVLEEDAHYEKNNNWYKEVGMNLIIQRHYNSFKRFEGQEGVPVVWLPFSVDVNTFKPNIHKERINTVGFAGTCNHAYPERQYMTEFLRKNHLIEGFFRKEKIGSNYIDFLQSYAIILSGLSSYKITPAKMFEIMACGALLFTNDDGHLEKLFPKDSYLTYVSDSHYQMTNLINNLKELLRNKSELDRKANKGLECIKTRHTHEIRTAELVSMLQKL